MSMPDYAPVPHARMIYMPDFRGKRFAAWGLMPTFDLLPNCKANALTSFWISSGFFMPL